MSTKHTPGPWKSVHHGWEYSTIYSSSGDVIAKVKISDAVTEDTQEEYEGEKEANANLLSAAPDLLAVLEDGRPPLPELLEWVADSFVSVHGVSPHMDYVTALRRHAGKSLAAIAKAKGEA